MNQQSYGNYGQNMEQQQGNYMNQSQQMMYPQGMMNSNHMNNQINNQMMGSNHMGNPINNQMMNSNHMNNQMNNQMGNQMGKHQNQSQQFHPQHYMNSSSQEQPMYSQQQNMSHGNQINNQINNQMGQVNSQMNNQMGIHQNQSQQFHPPSYSTSQEQMMYSQQNMMGHNQMSGMQNQMNNQMINRGNQQPVMMNQMPPASYQNNSGMNMNTVNQQSQSHPQSQQIVPPNRNQGMSQQFMQQPHSQLPNQQSQMQNQPPQMPQHQMRQQPQGNMMPQPPSSHHNMPQPSPQAYQTNSVPPFNQPPGSVGSMHAHTPLQQQLGVPQRNPDGRFASPASVTQKSPATAVFSNQPMSNTQVNRPVVPVARQASPVPQALHFPPLPTDPILANRDLTVGPLRRALADICQKAEYLLSLKFSTDTLMQSAQTNSSTGPSDNQSKNFPTAEDVRLARKKYNQSVTHFMLVLDDIENNLAALTEAVREQTRFDSLAVTKVPSDLQQRPYVDLLTPIVDSVKDDQHAIESVIKEMNDIVQRVKACEKANSN